MVIRRRSAGRPSDVMRRREPGLAVFAVQPLNELVAQQLAASRFLTWLTGVFAATALVLAIIGIYGLLAYWVGQRTREIGVRAALGAGRGQLIGLVVGQGVMLAAIGVVAGGLAAAVLGRFVETQLYAVQPARHRVVCRDGGRDDRDRVHRERGAGVPRVAHRSDQRAARRVTDAA